MINTACSQIREYLPPPLINGQIPACREGGFHNQLPMQEKKRENVLLKAFTGRGPLCLNRREDPGAQRGKAAGD